MENLKTNLSIIIDGRIKQKDEYAKPVCVDFKRVDNVCFCCGKEFIQGFKTNICNDCLMETIYN